MSRASREQLLPTYAAFYARRGRTHPADALYRAERKFEADELLRAARRREIRDAWLSAGIVYAAITVATHLL